jgi:protein SCO1
MVKPASLAAVWAIGAMLACLLAPPAEATNLPGHSGRPVGIRLEPLFKLTNHHGHAIDRDAVRARPFILMFGYTNCADVCPTSLFEASALLEQLGRDGDRLPVLFVTVDPERDSVEVLRDYLQSFDARIIGLTGSAAEVKAVATSFSAGSDADAQKEEGIGHLTQMFLIDRYGLLARAVPYDDPDSLGKFSKRLLAQ